MKPIIEKSANTILTKDITDSHFVGVIICGKPFTVQEYGEGHNSGRTYYLGSLNSEYRSNIGKLLDSTNIQELVEAFLPMHMVGVFNTHKELLEWLLSNSG